MSRMKSLLCLLVVAAQVPLASATVTYVVGACKPTFPPSSTFQHISDAITATPRPNVVEICPGTYPEQFVINFPVTLEGVSDGSSTGATISVPSGGLVVNGTNAAVQVWIQNPTGEVNLNNLTVDGTGNNVSTADVVGVFYQNSPGTMNHLTVQNQFVSGGGGLGVVLQGGSANPTVTLENSIVQGFSYEGIVLETNVGGDDDLTAIVKGNYVSAGPGGGYGIAIGGGIAASVSGNLITGPAYGIFAFAGSVSKNTVIGAATGIWVEGSVASVSSNTVFNTPGGIFAGTNTATVSGNTITQSVNAIGFACLANNNVHSNTILGAANGLINVQSGALSTNTYYGVGTIRSGGC